MGLRDTGASPVLAAAAKEKKLDASDLQTGGATIHSMNRAAARIIMTMMYAARLARRDLLRAVSHLATYFTK